jgi:hypothetical protein
VADFDEAIPPGGVGKITLEINTAGYQGKVTKSALVYSNDPDLPKTNISLSLNVKPYILVEPKPRVFLSGVSGAKIKETLHLKGIDDFPLEISRVETNLQSDIEYTLRRNSDSNEYDLEVSAKDSARRITTGYLTLFTNHPKKKELRLPVRVHLKKEFEIFPRRLVFNWDGKRMDEGNGVKRKLFVVRNRDQGFRLQDFQYNKDYFQVRLIGAVDDSPSKYELEVVPLLSKLPLGMQRIEDTLTIKTDDANTKELKVPLTINIRRAGEASAGGQSGRAPKSN